MIARKHVIRSGFSAAVSLPLTGVGRRGAPLHTHRKGQVSKSHHRLYADYLWAVRTDTGFFSLPGQSQADQDPESLCVVS